MRKKNLVMGIMAAFFVAVSLMGNCQAARPNVSDTVGVEKFIEAFNRIASEDGIYRITNWKSGDVDEEYQDFVCFVSDKVSPPESIVLLPVAASDGYLNSVVLSMSPQTSYAGRAAAFIPVYIVRAFGNTDLRDTQKVTGCVNQFMARKKTCDVIWESSNGKVYRVFCDRADDPRRSFIVGIYCPSE